MEDNDRTCAIGRKGRKVGRAFFGQMAEAAGRLRRIDLTAEHGHDVRAAAQDSEADSWLW
jgi:hypothetical protein